MLKLATAAVAALLLVCCIPSHADDSVIDGVSGSAGPYMGKSDTIRMVREDVHITGLPEGRVTARFVFTNEGPATDVTMGFPGYSSDDSSPKLQHFKSYVDGKPVKTKRIVTKHNPDDMPTDQDGKKHDQGPWEVWYTKRVHFAAGQTRIVIDSYDGGGGGDTSGHLYFVYVIRTGAAWKETIGRAVITADLSGIRKYSLVGIEPAGYTRNGDIVTWDLRDLEPTDDSDIKIEWLRGFNSVEVNGKALYASTKDSSGRIVRDPNGYYNVPTRDLDPVRRGNDVWLPAATAAEWLHAKRQVVTPGKVERITLGDYWAEFTVGSPVVRTSSGAVTMKYPCARQLGDVQSSGQRRRLTVIGLSPLVRALGGHAWFDKSRDVLVVQLPKP
jgi:hypothetical protein